MDGTEPTEAVVQPKKFFFVGSFTKLLMFKSKKYSRIHINNFNNQFEYLHDNHNRVETTVFLLLAG